MNSSVFGAFHLLVYRKTHAENLPAYVYWLPVAKSVGSCADLERRFVDDVLVRFRVPLLVVHVPAELFEQRVDELNAQVGFVELGRAVFVGVAIEGSDEGQNFAGNVGHHESVFEFVKLRCRVRLCRSKTRRTSKMRRR